MTLKEYLEDYASSQTKEAGVNLINNEVENLEDIKIKSIVKENLIKISSGERDFCF